MQNDTIYTDNEETFFKCIYQLIKLGLSFKADADTLIIELTGGY